MADDPEDNDLANEGGLDDSLDSPDDGESMQLGDTIEEVDQSQLNDDLGGFAPPPPRRPTVRIKPSVIDPEDDEGAERTTTIKIKTPSAHVKTPKPANDQFAWLDGAKSGTVRVKRIYGNSGGITIKGKATRGKHKGEFVGLGDCGFLDAGSDAETLVAQIQESWGGGIYTLEHLSPTGKVENKGQINLPQDPKPLDGISEDDEDEDDEDEDEEHPGYRPPFGHPGMMPGGMMSPYGIAPPFQSPYQPNPYAPQNPYAANRIFTPPQIKEKEDQETAELRKKLEEANLNQVKSTAEMELERLKLEQRQEEARLKAEIDKLKEMMQNGSRTSSEETKLMIQMMQHQAEQQRLNWEKDRVEQRERAEREAAMREQARKDEQDRREREERERIRLFEAENARRERERQEEKERIRIEEQTRREREDRVRQEERDRKDKEERERIAREAKEREERIAREAKEREEKNAKEIRDREERIARENKEREDRKEEAKLAREQMQQQMQLFQTMQTAIQTASQANQSNSLGIKDVIPLITGNREDPLAALNQAFTIVERAQGMSGGNQNDGDNTTTAERVITAATPVAQTFLQALAAMAMRPQAPQAPANGGQLVGRPPQQPNGQPAPQLPNRPNGQPGQPGQPQPAPAAPAPVESVQGSSTVPEHIQLIMKVSKVLERAVRAHKNNVDPAETAIFVRGAADILDLGEQLDKIAETDVMLIKQQLLMSENLGLAPEIAQPISDFVRLIDTDKQWVDDLMAELRPETEEAE